MLVLHANFSDGTLHVWAESQEMFLLASRPASTPSPRSAAPAGSLAATALAEPLTAHPFAASPDKLTRVLLDAGLLDPECLSTVSSVRLRLPASSGSPEPSDRLGSALGFERLGSDPELATFDIPTIALRPDQVLAAALRMEDRGPTDDIEFSHDLRYWFTVARFVLELLVDQRFVPTLIQSRGVELRAAWQPWLHDTAIRPRVNALLASMPPVSRAVVNAFAGRPWPILDDALRAMTDATVRAALINDNYADAIDGRDPTADANVAWLSGLLGHATTVQPPAGHEVELLRDVRRWITHLDEGISEDRFRLSLTLLEPPPTPVAARNGKAESFITAADHDWCWRLAFSLVNGPDAEHVADAEQLWGRSGTSAALEGQSIEQAQEFLLTELARASRMYPAIESSLAGASPTGIDLDTAGAYEFLTRYRPVLEESGFVVRPPQWWDDPAGRLGARLLIESPDIEPSGGPAMASGSAVNLGLASLVTYRWQVSVGDLPLTLEQFQQLAKHQVPLVRVDGRWVQIRPQDVAAAIKLLGNNAQGEGTLLQAIRLAHGADAAANTLPVTGLDATGWVASILNASATDERLPLLDQPVDFKGDLRPYQRTGLSWLAFLDRFGLGACLADDMGLGKTIQLIALLLAERNNSAPPASLRPTILVVPTSVVANWTRELERFAPSLRYHVHHGLERPTGDRFVALAEATDVVITTYALVSRDAELLNRITWQRVVLDEAQYIKNPPTKQATAIRNLKTTRRIALTGTPVENRLSELWSIMEFCNPGYLGPAAEFRRLFAVPVERHRDRVQAERLRNLVRPFILRRLKTDPLVISDLPACLETKEFATLTAEQATLYENLVKGMLAEVDRAEGMQRRGLILATLVKLKQLCNHPALLLKEHAETPSQLDAALASGSRLPLASRSGKCARMLEMLEEILAGDNRALIFTQFRHMGHLLGAMIQHQFDRPVLFLHGGTPAAKRQELIDRFQAADGSAPVFILSLKAGGIGLNLTAANHVFHFDRWWNPAVEDQATDRAFRIGQTRTVHVHKFVCVGTLEERIDQMIEQKTRLAENIIGAGEQWVTELSSGQLRDLLMLRTSALDTDA